MRSLILADVHANIEALNAIFADAGDGGGFDEVWCLGDTVGYGPDPGACLDLLREHQARMVAGNHDLAAVGLRSIDDFNPDAQASARWTRQRLTREEVTFLRGLPLTLQTGEFTLVHGSLRDPVNEYLLSGHAALATFALLKTAYCLVGHSHIPFLCREEGGAVDFVEFVTDRPIALNEARWIINSGGVGQPRDLDPRPSYAIYDSVAHAIERRRVAYDISNTQAKMRKAGLPRNLIERLDYGR